MGRGSFFAAKCVVVFLMHQLHELTVNFMFI